MNFEGYEKAEPFKLGNISGWGEDFVQRLIAEDPTVLGLGELVVKERERRHKGAGRLDFLLQDSPPSTRYTVEIQLGETDPSHIVRTIEYWDRERRSSPQFEHIAVIVAEGITSRFYNVISLFNQHIPLIAIKMSGITVGDRRSIIFTKILDYTPLTVEDEESGIQETDRSDWEKKTSVATMRLVDLIVTLAKKVNPKIGPRYKKGSIPLKIGSEFWRFLTIWPKKTLVKLSVPVPRSEDLEVRLNDASLDFDTYDELRKRYVLTLTANDLPKQEALIQELISKAYQSAQDETHTSPEE